VVYASTSLALAAVETFVNIEPRLQPKDLISLEGDIPEALELGKLEATALPADWYKTRDESLRKFDDEWIQRGKTVALLVPSAAIRGEWNVLLNPAHPEFSKIVFREPESFEFGTRMFH
jgi:RES domain-containing protein